MMVVNFSISRDLCAAEKIFRTCFLYISTRSFHFWYRNFGVLILPNDLRGLVEVYQYLQNLGDAGTKLWGVLSVLIQTHD